jgi:ADP-heptose:LPS heptosyltransferase
MGIIQYLQACAAGQPARSIHEMFHFRSRLRSVMTVLVVAEAWTYACLCMCRFIIAGEERIAESRTICKHFRVTKSGSAKSRRIVKNIRGMLMDQKGMNGYFK